MLLQPGDYLRLYVGDALIAPVVGQQRHDLAQVVGADGEATGKGEPIGWNDWGGHWQVIIGYDTMGTDTVQDDVIVAAAPYDTTDHNQDGYGVYSAERFLYNFTFAYL